jgi:CDP-glucose 4,6-dehydratase
MGTVNVLEAIRKYPFIKSALIVTTDKCYENKEWVWGYRENDPIGGYDPYSSSKGCAELVTAAYRQSFFSNEPRCLIASARAGNVIGGGDWSEDRLIPDAIRAFSSAIPLVVRNPNAVRPWQHVLEPISGYLLLAQKLYEVNGDRFSSSWNFGPVNRDSISVNQILDLVVKSWPENVVVKYEASNVLHEAHLLSLDCSKANKLLQWNPRWRVEQAVKNTVDWYVAQKSGKEMRAFSNAQIKDYFSTSNL